MATRLFDTRTRTFLDLPPAPAQIGMYFCGPTVYARAHIGNARPFVFGMLLTRWLRHQGREVVYVHNLTDVNDKIYDAATTESSVELAARACGWYKSDIEALGLGMPDRMPKVTETMPEIIAFVQSLIESGAAYAADGGVYFRISDFDDYGAISGQQNAREETEERNEHKEDPADFALWKATKPGEDTSWDSPWGAGRPGWHIECSAMVRKELGDTFAVHGGGLDLCFPHHDNELAQSESLGLGFAEIWAHNAMLEFSGEKMSKSVGNLQTIEEALEQWGAATLVTLFLSVHWRRSLDYGDDTLTQAAARVRTLRNALMQNPAPHDEGQWSDFATCLDDNFDTARALVVLHRWATEAQIELLRRGLDIFGLVEPEIEAPDQVRHLAGQRVEAKGRRDFDRADELRAQILALGWRMRDGAGGAYQLIAER